MPDTNNKGLETMIHGIVPKLEALAHFLTQTKGGALTLVAATLTNLVVAISIIKANF